MTEGEAHFHIPGGGHLGEDIALDMTGAFKHKHRPCPCGCGELADECMSPGNALNAFTIGEDEWG